MSSMTADVMDSIELQHSNNKDNKINTAVFNNLSESPQLATSSALSNHSQTLPGSDDFNAFLRPTVARYRSFSDAQQMALLDALLGASRSRQRWRVLQQLPALLSRDFVSLLPIELVSEVMSHVDGESLLRCCCVSHSWRRVLSSKSLSAVWRRLCLNEGVRNMEAEASITEQNQDGEGHALDIDWRAVYVALRRRKRRMAQRGAFGHSWLRAPYFSEGFTVSTSCGGRMIAVDYSCNHVAAANEFGRLFLWRLSNAPALSSSCSSAALSHTVAEMSRAECVMRVRVRSALSCVRLDMPSGVLVCGHYNGCLSVYRLSPPPPHNPNHNHNHDNHSDNHFNPHMPCDHDTPNQLNHNPSQRVHNHDIRNHNHNLHNHNQDWQYDVGATLVRHCTAHMGPVFSLDLNTSCDILLSGSADNTMKAYTVSSGCLVTTLGPYSHWVVCVRLVVTLTTNDKCLTSVTANPNVPHTKSHRNTSQLNSVNLLAMTRDNIHVYHVSFHGTCLVDALKNVATASHVVPLAASATWAPRVGVDVPFFTPGCHVLGGHVVYVAQPSPSQSDDRTDGADIMRCCLLSGRISRLFGVGFRVKKLLAIGSRFALLLAPMTDVCGVNLYVVDVRCGEVVGRHQVPHSRVSTPDAAQMALPARLSWLDGFDARELLQYQVDRKNSEQERQRSNRESIERDELLEGTDKKQCSITELVREGEREENAEQERVREHDSIDPALVAVMGTETSRQVFLLYWRTDR